LPSRENEGRTRGTRFGCAAAVLWNLTLYWTVRVRTFDWGTARANKLNMAVWEIDGGRRHKTVEL
jgi:hypothetical protein